jgi:hypothetical protein
LITSSPGCQAQGQAHPAGPMPGNGARARRPTTRPAPPGATVLGRLPLLVRLPRVVMLGPSRHRATAAPAGAPRPPRPAPHPHGHSPTAALIRANRRPASVDRSAQSGFRVSVMPRSRAHASAAVCRSVPARSAAAVAMAPGLPGFAEPERGISPGMRPKTRRTGWRGLSNVESPRSHQGLASSDE